MVAFFHTIRHHPLRERFNFLPSLVVSVSLLRAVLAFKIDKARPLAVAHLRNAEHLRQRGPFRIKNFTAICVQKFPADFLSNRFHFSRQMIFLFCRKIRAKIADFASVAIFGYYTTVSDICGTNSVKKFTRDITMNL